MPKKQVFIQGEDTQHIVKLQLHFKHRSTLQGTYIQKQWPQFCEIYKLSFLSELVTNMRHVYKYLLNNFFDTFFLQTSTKK